MKKLLLLLSILFLIIAGVGSVFAQESINWINSYEEGYELANKSNKNVIVFITAPSWCGWCQWMDENVLNQKEIIDMVNENFIAIKVLDKIDGEKNPDLEKVSFSGYPTLLFTDSDKKVYASVNAVEVDRFLDLCDLALNYEEKVKEYEEKLQKAKKDGEYAVKYIEELFNEGIFYDVCQEHGFALYGSEDLNKTQKETVLFYSIYSALMANDTTFIIEKSEIFIKEFPDASQEHIETVLFSKIAALYYSGDYDKAMKEAQAFVEKYPESYYVESLNQLIEMLKNEKN